MGPGERGMVMRVLTHKGKEEPFMGKWGEERLGKRKPETLVLAETDGSLPQRH